MVLYGKSFIGGVIFASTTWVISIYLYWVLTSSNEQAIGHSASQSALVYVDSNKLRQTHPTEKPSIDNDDDVYDKSDAGYGVVRTPEDKLLRDNGYKAFAFNVLASQRIGFTRTLPDTRHELCKFKTYPENLPSVSIIICFYNEHFHTLIRSVQSILDRTPRRLLKEIILVDDYSDGDMLHEEVQNQIANISKQFNFGIYQSYYKFNSQPAVQIRLLKTTRREGLIRARLFGAENSTADVIVFLDSHIEVNKEWLEPLVTRLSENLTSGEAYSNRVVIPIIDVINPDTFQYKSSPLVRGGFNWGLHFNWDNVPRSLLQKKEDFVKPIKTPTMAGGLFAIYREYFNKMGKYDPLMDTWGGENLEMSFRIWMCGGELEILPCSRVGHVFRQRRPYGSVDGTDSMLHNSLRLAHVWMDSYLDNYLKKVPSASSVEFGDISERQNLRKQLGCKSFQWYLDTIYPELILDSDSKSKVKEKLNAISDPQRNIYQPWHSRKRNYTDSYQLKLTNTFLCIQAAKDIKTKGGGLILATCIRTPNQMWYETVLHELVLGRMLCLESEHGGDGKAYLAKCHELAGTQDWRHKAKNGSPVYNTAVGTCLSVEEKLRGSPIIMKICSSSNMNSWDFIRGF